MVKKYEPELGQMIFGNPTGEIAAPEYLEAALRYLRDEFNRVAHNLRWMEFEDPFSNTGGRYECEIFQVNAYYWGDCYCGLLPIKGDKGHAPDCPEILPNFKWCDLEVRWYKYLGRGMSLNRSTTPQEVAEMLDECLAAVRNLEKGLYGND